MERGGDAKLNRVAFGPLSVGEASRDERAAGPFETSWRW